MPDNGTIPGYDPGRDAGDCTFDESRADRVCRFFETMLVHVKGEWAGNPFLLEPWERAILRALFGWIRPDGNRRYRECFVYVPRKNAKTTVGGGLVAYGLLSDNEPGAEIYSAAAEREQAALVYQQTRGMVEANPELLKRCKIYTAVKRIHVPSTNSFYAVLSADSKTKHGFNSHLVIVDELHAQPNRDLVDVLKTSMGARRQPLLIYLTTADFAGDSICNETLDYARGVRDGTVADPYFLPVIYEATTDDDWTDEAVWRRVNPNYGVSIKPEYFAEQCAKAQQEPSYENTFKRLHLNIQTEQQTRWLTMEDWQECGDCPAIADGATCYGGLDLSTVVDLSALVLLFPETWSLLCHFWIPEHSRSVTSGKNQTMYRTWINRGYIETTPGDVIDYSYIRARIVELSQRYLIIDVGYDPYNATQMAVDLKEQDGILMVEFRQGFISMNEPSKEFEKLVIGRILRHGDNPVLNWMASNVAVQTDPAGNIKPVKPAKDSPLKIDGIVAAIMALGRAMFAETQGASIYETEDPMLI